MTESLATRRRPKHHAFWVCLVIAMALSVWTMLAPTGAGAQTDNDAAAAPAAPTSSAVPAAPAQGTIDLGQGSMPTVLYLFKLSPWINGIIAALSVLALVLFIYFILTINTLSMAPPAFVDDVTKLVINRDYEEAVKYCRSHRHIFAASIIQRCVENASKQQTVIMDMLDTEGRRRADLVWNRISYLADVSNVAPMLGLLGTVIGMIKAFFMLPEQQGSITSRVLSEGVGQAMATTMFGLIVAILALTFYSLVKARATGALADVEQVVHSVADHIKRGDNTGAPAGRVQA